MINLGSEASGTTLDAHGLAVHILDQVLNGLCRVIAIGLAAEVDWD